MGFNDMIAAIDGFQDHEIAEYNRMRHIMWASLAAMGGDKTPSPHRLMPLPIDNEQEYRPMSKEEFIALANRMADLDKRKIAKA